MIRVTATLARRTFVWKTVTWKTVTRASTLAISLALIGPESRSRAEAAAGFDGVDESAVVDMQPMAPPQTHPIVCQCPACRILNGQDPDVLAGSNPPGGAVLSTSIPAADPNGVFAAPYAAGIDSRHRTARSLLIYLHDAGTPDMYNKTLTRPVLTATTRYEYLQKVANDQRQWLAVNSGGRMDSTYDLLDSGGIGYKDPATNTRWSSAFDVLPSILAANGITQSNYDYVQLVYDDVWGSPYFQGTDGAAGVGTVGDGFGTEVMWAVDYARRHELGHNLGFMHANSLRSQNNPTNGSYSTSLYRYDFANQVYVSATSVRNNPTDQVASPTIGLIRNDYGNPIDVMATNDDYQFGTRDKQRAGWLDGRHFASITGTANGAVATVAIHDPAELVTVTTGTGSDIRYGVARGYGDVPYTATIYRKGQEFVADASGTSGSWNTVVQKIDLTTVQLTGTTYGIEFRLGDAYVGVIQAGQTVSERDIAQFNRIVYVSPWSTTVGPDLVNDLHAGAPDNPALYRSSWFDLGYVSTGSGANGTFANLQVTTHIGATLGGKQWDAASGSSGAQDGGGTWTVGGGGWRNVDAGTDDQAWVDGDTATFGAASGSPGSVTVAGTVAARSLTFKPVTSGSYALGGGTISLGSLGVNAEASASIGSGLSWSANQVWEIVGGRSITVSGSITANGKTWSTIGSGTLVLASSGSIPSLQVLEGTAIQRSNQAFDGLTLGNTARYDLEAGTLKLSPSARLSNGGENGLLRILTGTASTTASPDIAFFPDVALSGGATTPGSISANVFLGEGRHVITAARAYYTDYDFSLGNGLYKPATFSGDISGPGGIDFVGSVTSAQLVLSGSNSFTGDLRIQRGSVHLGGADALRGAPTVTFDTSATTGDARLYLRGTNQTVTNLSSTGAGSATVANSPAGVNGGQRDATLTVNSTSDTTFAGLLVDTLRELRTSSTTVANPLGLVKIGTARLTLTGSNTYTGPTVVSAGELRVGTGGTLGAIGPGPITANGTLTFNRSDAVLLSHSLSGTGIVRQAGPNVLRLTGSSPFTGTVDVSAGSLDADGNHAAAAVSVAANTSLTGSGTVGVVTMAGGATLTGNYGSTFTMGGLSLADTTVVTAAFDRAEAPALFQVNGGLVLDGLLDVTSQDVMWAGVYRLFNYTGGLTNNGLQIRSLPSDVSAGGVSIQTSVAGQVNLYNGNDTGSNFWNGGSGGGSGIAGGSGTWKVGTANWTNSAGSQSGLFERLPTLAVFQSTGGTVTVDNSAGQVAATGFQFTTNGYRLAGGAVQLMNGSSGSAVVRVGDGSGASGGMTATIDTVLSGTAGVTKTDAGTAVLTAANTFTGVMTVRSGTVVVPTLANGGVASGLGQSSAAAANLVLDGGAVRFTAAAAQSTDRSFTVGTGGGALDVSPAAGGSVTFTSGSAIAFTGSGARSLSLGGSGTGSLAAIFGDGTGGASSLVKTGTGTWVLTGLNTYTGTTTVLAGKLQIGTGGASGNIGSAGSGAATNLVTVAAGATLEFNRTGTIDNKTAGTARMRAVAGGGTIVVNGGAVFFNYPGTGSGFAETNSWSGFSGSIDVIGGSEFRTIRNGATAMGTGTVTLGNGTTSGILSQIEGQWTWTNPIALVGASNQILNRSTGSNRFLKLQGILSGAGGLLLSDTANTMTSIDSGFILTGANTLSGAVTINGPVRVGGVTGDSASTDAGTGGSLGTAAVSINSGKTLTFSRSDAHVVAATIAGSGTVRIGSAGITGVGTQTVTVAAPWSHTGGTSIVAGTLVVGNGGTTGSVAGNIANASALRFNRSDVVTYTGTITGTGSVTQAGSGALRFTTAQAYAGTTTVSAGRLVVEAGGSIGSSAGVIIDGSSADLRWNSSTPMTRPLTFTQGSISGTGAIGVAVSVGANQSLAPGNSPGTQAYTAGLTLTAGGSYVWEIDDALGTKGFDWDSISVSGGALDLTGLSAGGTFTLNLATLTSGGSAGALANYVDGSAYTWRLFDTTSLLLPSSFAGSAAGVGTYTAGLDVTSLFGIGTANWFGTKPSAGLMSLKVGGDGRGLDLVFSSANTTVYWSPTAGAGGSGTWSGGQSWATASSGSGSAQAGSGAAVVFGGVAGTVTTSGTVEARQINFTSSGYTVAGGTGSRIALSGSAPAVALGNGVTATIAATVSGTGSLAITGSGSRGRLNLAGDSLMSGGIQVSNALLSLSGSVQGGVSLAADASLAGTGRIGGAVTGSGVVNPGNSPGIITAAAVDPSSGMDFVLEFSGTAPAYGTGTASINDVLRLTGSTPFLSPLTAGNTKTLFLNFTKAGLGLGTILEGGFFTDADADFTSMLNNYANDNAGFAVYVLGDGLGTDNSLNGQGYYNWRNPAMFGWTQSLFMSTTAVTADFGSGPVEGRAMQLLVAVPEPSTYCMALAGLACGGFSLWRRRKRA